MARNLARRRPAGRAAPRPGARGRDGPGLCSWTTSPRGAPVLDRLVRQAYLRLGRRYGVAYVLAQGPSSLAIATIALVLVTSYYDPSTGEVLLMLAVTWASTLAAIAFALWRGRPYLSRALAWQSSPGPRAEESIAAWDAATNYPMRSFRANVLSVGTIAAAP